MYYVRCGIYKFRDVRLSNVRRRWLEMAGRAEQEYVEVNFLLWRTVRALRKANHYESKLQHLILILDEISIDNLCGSTK